jgi:hypothetical protein
MQWALVEQAELIEYETPLMEKAVLRQAELVLAMVRVTI